MKKVWLLFKTTIKGWNDDYAQSMGAALAFYTLFSITPVLLIVLSILGLAFGADAAEGEIVGQLNSLLGEQGALAVQTLLENVNQPEEGFWASLIGVILLLIGATTVFAELQSSLDRIWRAPERIKVSGIIALLNERLLSFGLILGIGFILMVSLVFSAGISAISEWWSPRFDDLISLLTATNLAFSFITTTAMFTLIYKLMPSVKIAWSEVIVGAVMTALLFSVGKFLIGLYIGRSGVTSGFGAAGSLIALLIWVYYSAQIFLLGAEFTWAYSHIYGARKKLVELDINKTPEK